MQQWGVRNLVVDPVMVSTSGHSLAEGGVAAALLSTLMPLATLVTPNIPEASALLGAYYYYRNYVEIAYGIIVMSFDVVSWGLPGFGFCHWHAPRLSDGFS